MHIFVENPWGLLDTWLEWIVVTGRLWCLSPEVSLDSKTGFLIRIACPHELDILVGKAALRGHMVADVRDSAVRTIIRKGAV